jgi:rod shape-determining protein MreD
MNRELRTILISTVLLGVAVLLQSTVLRWVALKGVKPDLALILLVFVAVRRGSMSAQTSGFLAGLLEDALSLAPVGFNALLRTVLGFFYGLLSGSIFVDPVLMPVLLVMVATLLKGLLSSLLVVLFRVPAPGFEIFAGPLWIEVGYNAVLAPFLFAPLRRLRALAPREKDRV